jgi:hypothetical protein
MSDFLAGVSTALSVQVLTGIILYLSKEHIMLRLNEPVKKKTLLEIENRKGEILTDLEAKKSQYQKDLQSIKLTLDKDFENYKQQYERTKITNEHYHQIAQEAYRNFFNSKMKAYLGLAKLKQEFLNKLHAIDFIPDDYEPSEFLPMTELNSLINFVNKNRIYLSENLIIKYDEWYSITSQKISAQKLKFYDDGGYSRYSEMEVSMHEDSFERQVYLDNQNFFQIFLDEIDMDVKALRKKYDL